MVPSLAGVLICCGLFAAAWFTERPLIVALMASIAFGSTAIVTLTALGGSSPLIYVVFLMALFATVALRRDIMRELGVVLTQQPLAWLVLLLALYTVVGALVLPRMFAGETTAFIPVRSGGGAGGIAEIPLMPVPGNITQSMYFVLTALSFFAFSVLLLRRETFGAIRTGFFAWASVHASLGFIDLLGKIAGLGDVLAPIRSATYAMLTEVDVAGFWRIAGGYSEASAFGATTVSLLAFTFTYWRITQNRFALVLTAALFVLFILSTSSTAYVAGAILLMVVLASVTTAALRDRLRKQDLLLIAALFAALCVIVGAVVHSERILDPFWRLLDMMILDKASSASGEERAYWNYRSLQSVVDTVGLGIGIGSSRASSWLIAVISQLGVVGTLMIGYLTFEIIRGVGVRGTGAPDDRELHAIANSARAACLAGLVTASISSGDADPGLRFYIALAVISSYRQLVGQRLGAPVHSARFALSRPGLPSPRGAW